MTRYVIIHYAECYEYVFLNVGYQFLYEFNHGEVQ